MHTVGYVFHNQVQVHPDFVLRLNAAHLFLVCECFQLAHVLVVEDPGYRCLSRLEAKEIPHGLLVSEIIHRK